MSIIKPDFKSALPANLSGILALLLVFVAAAACTFNTGGADACK